MIKNTLNTKKPSISFEIFPPKVGYPIQTIYDTIDSLENLHPDFISVTYGAGGSTKDTTVEIASHITEKHNLSALAHLTCLTSTKEDIDLTLSSLKNKGVKNILALRGDYPEGADPASFVNGDFKYAVDLIKYIKERSEFCVGAACYPEVHIEASDYKIDLINLKNKVDAGADFLITQLFFDNEVFYDFKDKTELLGIDIPILVGILPLLNKNQIQRIIKLTSCTLPKKFLRILDKYEHSPEALKEAGIAYATEQIIDLLSAGVDGIHIYTMNKPDTVRQIMKNISAIRGVLTDEQLSNL